MILCPTCNRPMTALFTSCVCDWCDGLKTPEILDRGFVIVPGGVLKSARELHVFPTRKAARQYQRCTGTRGAIREVLSETRINWQKGIGTIPDLELADRLYTIFPDHRHAPAPYRAFLALAP